MLREVRIFREPFDPDLDPISLYSEDSHVERLLIRQLTRGQRTMKEVEWSLIMKLVVSHRLEGETMRPKRHSGEEKPRHSSS